MEEENNNSMAVWVFIIGLIGLVTWVIPLIGLIVSIIAITLGKIAAKPKHNRAFAQWAILLGTIGLIASIINAVVGGVISYKAYKDGQPTQNSILNTGAINQSSIQKSDTTGLDNCLNDVNDKFREFVDKNKNTKVSDQDVNTIVDLYTTARDECYQRYK